MSAPSPTTPPADDGETRTPIARPEERLELAEASLEHSRMATIWFAMDSRILRANSAMCRMIGYTREELEGMSLRDIDPGFQDPARWQESVRQIKARGSFRSIETLHRHKDGTIYPVEVSSSHVTCRGREYIFSFIRDDRPRKQANRDLRRAQHSIDRAPYRIFWLDLHGGFLYVNDEACRSLGYTREELLALSVKDVDPRFPTERWSGHLAELDEQGSLTFESIHRTKDGREFPVEIVSHAIDHEGERFVFAFVRDITERRQAEQAMRESEAKYRVLFEQSAEPMLLIDEGRFVDCNQAALALLESERDFVVGRLPWECSPEFQPDGRESREKAEECIARALDLGSYRFEWEHVRPSGACFPCEVLLTAIPFGQRQLVHVAWRDLTALKHAEHERERLEVQLRQSQKMEAIGQLAGGVAHDFNNLLTTILGNAELALQENAEGTATPGRLNEDLREIRQAAEHAAELTRQLLAFSRRQVVQPKLLALGDVISGLQKMLRRLLNEDIQVEMELDSALPPVRVDRVQIEQVVVNLAVNARDAMPSGGTLRIRTERVLLDAADAARHPDAVPGEHVLLSVHDSGQGIDPEVAEHIFEPFFTTKGFGQGTGLGLATVYGIVRQSGGHIEVLSERGKGTTFRLFFPAAQGELEPLAVPSASGPGPGGSETILLCEDHAAVRDLAAQILTAAGYRVLAAGTGREALGLSDSWEGAVPLLVTDVILPDTNGRAVSQALSERRPGLRTLFISGYTSNVIAQHGVLDEGVELLEKPFTRHALLERVRRLLDR